MDAIKASLSRFGQQKPIVVSPQNIVIAGNATLRAAKALGWIHISIVRTSLTGSEAIAYAIADNRTGDLSEFVDEDLAKQLQALQMEDLELAKATGFLDNEISRLCSGINVVEDDEIPEPMDKAISRTGDVWTLGGHRLMCGDSSKREDLVVLLAGKTIQLVNTDPPYNVKVEPRSNNAIAAGNSSFEHSPGYANRGRAGQPTQGHDAPHKITKMRPKDRPLANDFLPPEEFDRMLMAWFGNLAFAMDPGAAFYIWGGYANCANYPPALKENGLYFSQAIIWNKMHPVLTRKDYMGAHEWCFYGWKEGAGHHFYGPNNETDLWEIKKVNPQSMVHLTEKPVELAVRAINNSSQRGENVLDLFGGSGSTIMGCEHTDRRGFSMEMDPSYCDVIVQRWEKSTGKKADRKNLTVEA